MSTFTPGGNNSDLCYYMSDNASPEPWHSAAATCAGWNGTLISIVDQTMENFVYNKLGYVRTYSNAINVLVFVKGQVDS